MRFRQRAAEPNGSLNATISLHCPNEGESGCVIGTNRAQNGPVSPKFWGGRVHTSSILRNRSLKAGYIHPKSKGQSFGGSPAMLPGSTDTSLEYDSDMHASTCVHGDIT